MWQAVEVIISTHTLTWSVTPLTQWQTQTSEISTHTLTWSVTNTMTNHAKGLRISTHTLTWSVTGSSSLWEPTTGDFNSHAHVERDEMPLPVHKY